MKVDFNQCGGSCLKTGLFTLFDQLYIIYLFNTIEIGINTVKIVLK